MTVANTFRSLSRLTGAKRYAGEVCAKHPELYGERITSNGICLACNREKMRRTRAADPKSAKAEAHANYLKNKDEVLRRSIARGRFRRSGMDEQTFNTLFAMQDGKCAVCLRSIAEKRVAHADHCHDTKEVRGLLCSTCNQAEGLIRRSGMSAYDYGRKLQAYLDYPPTRYLE